jgi:hypothetical protein
LLRRGLATMHDQRPPDAALRFAAEPPSRHVELTDNPLATAKTCSTSASAAAAIAPATIGPHSG